MRCSAFESCGWVDVDVAEEAVVEERTLDEDVGQRIVRVPEEEEPVARLAGRDKANAKDEADREEREDGSEREHGREIEVERVDESFWSFHLEGFFYFKALSS